MEDRHALAQQVEFLKIQLHATEGREHKLKELYEGMIASLAPDDELAFSEANRQQLLDEALSTQSTQ